MLKSVIYKKHAFNETTNRINFHNLNRFSAFFQIALTPNTNEFNGSLNAVETQAKSAHDPRSALRNAIPGGRKTHASSLKITQSGDEP